MKTIKKLRLYIYAGKLVEYIKREKGVFCASINPTVWCMDSNLIICKIPSLWELLSYMTSIKEKKTPKIPAFLFFFCLVKYIYKHKCWSCFSKHGYSFCYMLVITNSKFREDSGRLPTTRLGFTRLLYANDTARVQQREPVISTHTCLGEFAI